MGLLRNILRTTAIGASAGIGTFFFVTRKNTFVPMDPTSSPLFSSKQATLFNPNKNPTSYDDCMRAVPFSQIKPELLKDKQALVTAFCAGVGPGEDMSSTICLLSPLNGRVFVLQVSKFSGAILSVNITVRRRKTSCGRVSSSARLRILLAL